MNPYPAIFVVMGLMRFSVALYDILSSWSQSVRDKEFLVELRLKNHDPEQEKSSRASSEETEADGDQREALRVDR